MRVRKLIKEYYPENSKIVWLIKTEDGKNIRVFDNKNKSVSPMKIQGISGRVERLIYDKFTRIDLSKPSPEYTEPPLFTDE